MPRCIVSEQEGWTSSNSPQAERLPHLFDLRHEARRLPEGQVVRLVGVPGAKLVVTHHQEVISGLRHQGLQVPRTRPRPAVQQQQRRRIGPPHPLVPDPPAGDLDVPLVARHCCPLSRRLLHACHPVLPHRPAPAHPAIATLRRQDARCRHAAQPGPHGAVRYHDLPRAMCSWPAGWWNRWRSSRLHTPRCSPRYAGPAIRH